MQHREAFLRQYESEVLAHFSLPSALRSYAPISCLKQGMRNVLLLRGDDGHLYVLKTQPTDHQSSLSLEYEVLQSFDHPQIPKPICCFQECGMEYLVREYVQGISLAELVAEKGPMDETTCLSTILSLCNVLAALHAQTPAIIHRDIKPQNVILSSDGTCHLVDFDTARYFAESKAEDTIYMGTRVSAPPEQFGFGQTDIRSDVYSLGMLARYLLTGSHDPLPAKSASWGLRQIVSRCTAFDPRRRFPTILAVRRAIRLLQRRKVILIALAAVVLALAVILCLPVPVEPPFEFTNPLLAKVVRMELGIPENAPIPRSRLLEVEELIQCGDECYGSLAAHNDVSPDRHDINESTIRRGNVGDLQELTQLANLRTLVLDFQSISDMEPLRALPLERLSMVGNRITDLSPLSDLHALITLELAYNPVGDLMALAELDRLVTVNLNDTSVRSLEAFKDSGIEKLCIDKTPILDYAPLSTLKNLRTLEAGYLDPAALQVVTQLQSLSKLTIHDCKRLKDFSAFSRMPSLQELDIAYLSFDSLDGLEQVSGLRYLNLSHTEIRDASVLQSYPALAKLELRNTQIENLTPLLNVPHLQRLVLDETQRAQAEEQLADATFELEIRPY